MNSGSGAFQDPPSNVHLPQLTYLPPGACLVPGSADRDPSQSGAPEGDSPMSHVDFKKSPFPCHYIWNVPADFKMVPCHMSILSNVLCRVVYFFLVSIGSMSHVDFKNWPCRRVRVRGTGPPECTQWYSTFGSSISKTNHRGDIRKNLHQVNL